ncbi:MAG: tetratricopeptide repeat protein [Candidatus Rifleibacteriota bacterium]
MVRKQFRLTLIVSMFLFAMAVVAQAQPTGPMAPDPLGKPQMPAFDDDKRPSKPGIRPTGSNQHPKRPGMPGLKRKPGKGMPNEEMMKQREKMQALQAIAEAHKNLARIYEQQNEIDKAAAELKKILDLFEEHQAAMKLPENKKSLKKVGISRKIIPVYHEIARLYMQNGRLDDAEKIMLEGIAKFEKEAPQSATKLTLELGEIYSRNNKLEKAEEMMKKVILINQKSLKE